jgi:hypothetical protein
MIFDIAQKYVENQEIRKKRTVSKKYSIFDNSYLIRALARTCPFTFKGLRQHNFGFLTLFCLDSKASLTFIGLSIEFLYLCCNPGSTRYWRLFNCFSIKNFFK